MNTATLQKNYRHLTARFDHLERLVKVLAQDELTPKEIKKLEAISRRLDAGGGKRFTSRQQFSRYLKSF